MARIRKAQTGDGGFTLIELLVVMIIIGILAAIAIPTFLAQRKNGWNTAAKTDVRNLATTVESYAVDAGGDYTKVFKVVAVDTSLVASGVPVVASWTPTLDFKGTTDVNITLGAAADKTKFCLVANNVNSSDGWFTYSSAKNGLNPATSATVAAAKTLC